MNKIYSKMNLSKFKIKKLKYAYTNSGIAHISIANKYEEYFLDRDLTIPLVFCSGDKNINHWRRRSNISKSDMYKVFGNSESIEHYNKKMEIAESLTFVDDELNIRYKAHSSKVEYRLLAINKVVDVAFFDDDGNILICVEVFKTNKKTSDDIDKFNKENIIVYEYDLQEGKSYPISAGTPVNEIKERIRKGSGIVQGLQRRIEMLEKGYQRVDKKRKKKWSNYYKEAGWIELKIEEIESEQRREQSRIYETFRSRLRSKYEEIRVLEKSVGDDEEKIKLLRKRVSGIRDVREEIIQIEKNE